jgi:S-adenosylmethionine synthetase
VTIEYAEGKPRRVDTVVISTQHSEKRRPQDPQVRARGGDQAQGRPADLLDAKTKFHINPTGRFVVGGPMGDSGLTGRKIIVDTYGGMGRHGGGAFSGKDPSKVDRSAAYYARYIAKNLVASRSAPRLRGPARLRDRRRREPGQHRGRHLRHRQAPDDRLEEIVEQIFDARPANIIRELDLLRPIYSLTAAYGHFRRRAYPAGPRARHRPAKSS